MLIAGPHCGQIYGECADEVIKGEAPGQGDPMSQWGRALPGGKSLSCPVLARNKKAVTLDLRQADG